MGEFLFSLRQARLAFGGPPVLDGVSLTVERGLRAALTGRNGEGKSTLLKAIAGEVECDSGEIARAPGLRTVYVSQEVPADRPGDDAFNALSGGRRRRRILEAAFLEQPDLLLLDEPTNHLDIESIDWLEGMIRRQRSMAVIVVTHDRRFLKRVATKIFDLDRGELSGWECDYPEFLRRKAELMADEAVYWSRRAKQLAREEAWIRRGVKARAARNEGRVAALLELRREFAARRPAAGTASLRLDTAAPGGARALKIEDLGFAYGDGRWIVRHFTADVLRGERIGILGGNGAGKTTLLKLLAGALAPVEGRVTPGTHAKLAFFDQLRRELNPEATVAENVAADRDEVTVGGVRKHVYAYLADFLFPPERARTPVKALSGGERARLMLAKLFLEPANLLMMDEPTNDLDVETLELLEEQLLAYQGTLLLVSHDREFLDHVVTSTFVLEGDGEVRVYPGGYEDYLRQRPRRSPPPADNAARPAPPAKSAPRKLGYMEQREFDALPAQIAAIEAQIAAVNALDPAKDYARYAEIPALEEQLDKLETRWLELSERAD